MASGPLPGAQAVSQFGAFLGACGEAAVAMLEHVWNGGPLTTAQVDQLVRRLLPSDPNAGNSTTPSELVNLLQQDNLPYAEMPLSMVWKEATYDPNSTTPPAPAILEVSQGGQLPGHTDAGLHNHYITLLGSDATGYFVGDSDTAAGKQGQLIHETRAQIEAAKPIAGIGLDPSRAAAQVVNGAGQGIIDTASAVPRLASAVLGILNGLTHANWRDIGWRALLIGFGLVIALVGLALFARPAVRVG